MPPKVRITREEIIRAAVDIVRGSGVAALNARDLAAALNCSTQPVFSNFENMDALRMEVVSWAENLCQQYMHRETEEGKYPPYKAVGMAYIRFAREEKELFKLLYMRDRTGEMIPEETDAGNQLESMIRGNVGLDAGDAKLFHLEMWAYVHGIAAMTATGYLDLEWELISRMLTDSFQGLKKQYAKE